MLRCIASALVLGVLVVAQSDDGGSVEGLPSAPRNKRTVGRILISVGDLFGYVRLRWWFCREKGCRIRGRWSRVWKWPTQAVFQTRVTKISCFFHVVTLIIRSGIAHFQNIVSFVKFVNKGIYQKGSGFICNDVHFILVGYKLYIIYHTNILYSLKYNTIFYKRNIKLKYLHQVGIFNSSYPSFLFNILVSSNKYIW